MIAGAGELERRIAEHAHWRLAEAVRDGRQSATDPDASRLIELGDSVRLYGPETPGIQANGAGGFEKRLVDGWWQVTRPTAA
jgi:hypothetical protein